MEKDSGMHGSMPMHVCSMWEWESSLESSDFPCFGMCCDVSGHFVCVFCFLGSRMLQVSFTSPVVFPGLIILCQSGIDPNMAP